MRKQTEDANQTLPPTPLESATIGEPDPFEESNRLADEVLAEHAKNNPKKKIVRRPISNALQTCAKIERLFLDLNPKETAIVVDWFISNYDYHGAPGR